MSDKIVLDLTEVLASGQSVQYKVECKLDSSLLPYPDAQLNKVELDLTAQFDKPNVRVFGQIVCHIDGFCDKCLAPVCKAVTLDFDQIFYKDSSDEVDAYVYTDSKLDVTKAISDEIALSLPTAWLCKEDCKGLCPKCGVNLNEQQCDCDTSRPNAFSALKNLKF